MKNFIQTMKKHETNCYLRKKHFFLRDWTLFLFLILCSFQVSANYSDNIIKDQNLSQQGKTITGKVTDGTGSPIPGVTIVVKGTSNGALTDADGQYSLSRVPENGVLVFSFVGLKTQEVPVNGNQKVDVVMQEETIELVEVVAVGYGVQRKSDVTGAVSSIKTEELVKRPITRIEQSLQGTTPGVQVISSSGQPGKGLSVKIRGASSITGSNEPLYVIDGNIGGGIDALNPNDIESIEILKDASSTAIYGSRGTNGVVLITTKSGKSGKTVVSFNTWFSNLSLPGEMDLLSGAEFAQVINKYTKAGSFSDAEISQLQASGGTKWLDAVTRNPWVKNYDLSVSGGTNAVRYRVSFNSLDQPGMLINSYYKKSNVRANLDVKANDRLDFKFNFSYIEPKSRNNNFGGDVYDPFASALIFDPTLPIRNSQGNYNLSSAWASNGYNPVAQSYDRLDDNSSKTTVGTGILTYKILDGLTFTSNNTYSTGTQFNQRYSGPLTNSTSEAVIYSNDWKSWQNSNFLTYDKNFGDHHLTATLLYEQSKYENVNVTATARNLSTQALTYYNLGLGGTQLTSSGYSSDALQSYMFRINYAYKNRYLVTMSVRRDGSSKLTDKYDNFPSAAIAWNIAQENFLKDHPVISGLKVRLSYGETGNQAVGAYSTIAQVNTGNPYYYDGTTAIPTTPLGTAVSKKLSWEHAKQTDFGVDVILYNGKLTFTADYYNKDVDDLLYSYAAPYYMGGGNYNRNMGKLNNKGFEASLSGLPVSKKNFSWTTNFTISFNRNKVVDLMGENNLEANGIGTFGAGVSRLIVGKPLSEFWGYKFLGTWKSSEAAEAAKFGMKPGDAKYFDKNNDNAYTPEDRMEIGNGTPDFSFGFSNDIQYKNFTLSIMFQGMSGNDIYSQTLGTMWGGHGIARNATIKDVLNAWTPEHETDIPVQGGTSANYFNSSRFVYDGSYIKLKNVSLTYSVPKRLINKIFLSKLDLFVSGQNLFTITNYPGFDPEVNSSTDARTQGLEMGVVPNPKTYTLGLRVDF